MSEEKIHSQGIQSKVIHMPTGKTESPSFRETLSRERASLRRSSQKGEHFWAATYPFFETSLCITPARVSSRASNTDSEATGSLNDGVCRSEVDIYDCDGELINTVGTAFPDDEVGIVELDPFLGACKLESGIKHAHIAVRSQSPGVSHYCRMVSQEHATMVGPAFSILPVMPTFFPITFGDSKSHLVVFVNYGIEDATVRCRLFFGTRTPEILCTIPGNGARILGVEGEFAECSARAQDRLMQGYVRLTTKSEAGVGCQLIERCEGLKENSLFYSLA